MSNAIFSLPDSHNEPILTYAPGSPERALLKAELERQYNLVLDIPLIIGGQEVRTGRVDRVVCPHDHGHVLATFHEAGETEVRQAIAAAMAAKKAWEATPWEDRAAIFHKMASLISTKYRYILNAATMLGQSKTAYQAEIDATCETADFFRYNAKFMEDIYRHQPISDPHVWNRVHYRALEGFVFAVTPFNFTAIGANLATAPAIMGNTVVWKPASTAMLSAHYLMQLFEAAGMPPGVINLVPGDPSAISNVAMSHRDLAGVHFTGSTDVFNNMWKTIGASMSSYRSYPRIVGETGGKDFVIAHASADLAALATAVVRGGFEFQGQKCSAVSRIYVPRSIWPDVRDRIVAMMDDIKMGDIRDFRNFMGAVIDERAFDRITGHIAEARTTARIVAGGESDKQTGYFVRPTLIETDNPGLRQLCEEIFGPVVTAYEYDDSQWTETLALVNATSPYALTGAIFAQDRRAVVEASSALRYAAGNFYINDKPTGAVVGQQPFGGARASGTNDKAGSKLNLVRWVS
ncbi:MAG: L-glutamate gamma-semialdehyde dehydrogenase, partial [Acidobacteria bacterium]|nr:L-glutamate gamma-semialdehyde dehydrogenase [Acidobacteriota bacterium]